MRLLSVNTGAPRSIKAKSGQTGIFKTPVSGTVRAALDAQLFIERPTTLGGPAPDTVRAHLHLAAARLARDTALHAEWQVRFQQTGPLEEHA